MEKHVHHFSELFEQLGLLSDTVAIQVFIKQHSPLAGDVALADAAFWSPTQAALLRDELQKDADWAEIIDQLNNALRAIAK